MAVVLTIIGVVIGSSVVVGTQQIAVQEIQKTGREMGVIGNALDIFVRIHGRLPCPAPINAAATDTTNFGREASDCADASPPAGITRVEYPASSGNYLRIGGVPTKALNLNKDFASDEWSGRFTYIVDESLITAITSATDGSIAIRDETGNTITSTAAYVLISHGPTGKGATHDRRLSVITACDATNKDGTNCGNTGLFINAKPNKGTVTANFFDDIVLWKTRLGILKELSLNFLP